MRLQLDARGYHHLTPAQRAEVDAWLTANDLDPNVVRCCEVTGEGAVTITSFVRDEQGVLKTWRDPTTGAWDWIYKEHTIYPATPLPHYNPA